ncbi:hypothetical protein ACFFK0_14225 [Paenibacillus chartarius]|uniref:PilZ domain-containing protein n=1 Tax=Paenibacillus chartarius TaxID=747481 RepID=A0ABV6DLX4_9BACL
MEGMERRQYGRTEVDPIEMVIEEIEGFNGLYRDVAVFIEEVSLMGLRFHSAIEFDINEVITFKLPSLDIMSLITGRIAWRRLVKDSGFQYGLEIIRENSD